MQYYIYKIGKLIKEQEEFILKIAKEFYKFYMALPSTMRLRAFGPKSLKIKNDIKRELNEAKEYTLEHYDHVYL